MANDLHDVTIVCPEGGSSQFRKGSELCEATLKFLYNHFAMEITRHYDQACILIL